MAKAATIRRGGPAWGEPEFIEDVPQGSPEWFQLRLGIPTASCFSMVVRDADAKTRREYLHKLAGEVLSGKPGEGKIVTAAMERGKEMEPRAREAYERKNVVPVTQIGFVRRKLPSGRYVGASPDGIVGKGRRKALEIKTLAPHLMVALLERGAALPPEHRWQVHGTIFVGGFEETDLVLYYDGMPVSPQFTVVRNEETARELSDALEVFDHELHQLVKRIRAMG